MAKGDLNEWITSIEHMGPFRTHPDGTLYVYAKPEEADPGDPSGIYVPAEEAVRRVLTKAHGTTDWTQAKRNEALAYLKDEAAPVFSELFEPLIPTINGVIDLSDPENIQLQEHSPLFGFISQVPHLYNPHAVCPKTEAFLYEACGGNEDMVQFVYELIGYSLLPFQFLRKAVMVTGPSGTGKSTVLYLLECLLGQGNCAYVPLQSIGDDRFATSDLFGKLANIGGDIDAAEIKNTGVFKSLTGDDYVRADVKYGKPVRFRSGATCWFAANEPPPSRDHTDAWRDRWIILPFNTKPERADFTLKAKLSSDQEMEGLLRHAIEGAANLLARGRLLIPEEVQAAHAEFVTRTDQVQGFLHHCTFRFPGTHHRDQLFAAYEEWARMEGFKPVRRSVLFQRADERWSHTDTHYTIPNGDTE